MSDCENYTKSKTYKVKIKDKVESKIHFNMSQSGQLVLCGMLSTQSNYMPADPAIQMSVTSC